MARVRVVGAATASWVSGLALAVAAGLALDLTPRTVPTKTMSIESHRTDTEVDSLSRARIVLYLEGMALLIGLAMPITPSKTGADGSLAEWFIDDPGYLEEVFVYFVLTNILLGLILLIAWIWHRLGGPATGAADASGPDSGVSSDE